MFYISPSPYISLIFLYKQKQLIMLLRGKQLLFTSLFATFVFPTSLAIHISLYCRLTMSQSQSSCDWACYTHLGNTTLMYVLITFFRQIVSILNRCWNLRQVINFEYKLRSVPRQILRVRIKYKIGIFRTFLIGTENCWKFWWIKWPWALFWYKKILQA